MIILLCIEGLGNWRKEGIMGNKEDIKQKIIEEINKGINQANKYIGKLVFGYVSEILIKNNNGK